MTKNDDNLVIVDETYEVAIIEEICEETEDEREARLNIEEQALKLKAIVFVGIPMLVGFLLFTYFFLNALELKSKAMKQEQQQEQSLSNDQEPKEQEEVGDKDNSKKRLVK